MATPEKTPPPPNRASRMVSWLSLNIPQITDWLLEIIAHLLVLSLSIFAIYCVFGLIFGNLTNSRIEKILSLLNDNWKALLVLGFAVFYPAIRRLLARANLGGIGPIHFVRQAKTMKEVKVPRKTHMRKREQQKDDNK
jgi:hypothetical protein